MNMMEALSITVSSMAIVFLTLLAISLILASFKFIFKEKPKKQEVKRTASSEAAMTEEIDEEEKVVVALAASIMAGEGKVNPNLQVTKISRIK